MSLRKKNILAALLLTIFAFHYANISFFYHSHTFNGVTIVHSHLHGKDHAKSGTHTADQITLIAAVSDFHILEAEVCQADLILLLVCLEILRIGAENRAETVVSDTPCLRGPPALA